MIGTILLITIVILIYYFLIKPVRYWQDKGVKCSKGVWPIVGNAGNVLLKKANFFDLTCDMYKEYPNDRYNGVYRFTSPCLLIRDLDLIKQITIKEFESFPDRFIVFSNPEDLISMSLIALKGHKWRQMRATLSPVFTTSKIRGMFDLINDCARHFSEYFLKQGGVIEIDVKKTIGKFATDVVASTAFGVKCDSLNDPENEFYILGQSVAGFGNLKGWKAVALFIPFLAKLIGFRLFPESLQNFFRKTIKSNIEQRESQNIFRPDLIQLLMEARKGKLKHEFDHSLKESTFAAVEESELGKSEDLQKRELSDDDITAQALLFFFAGFDTISTATCFTAHELAVNPDIQENLRNEIDDVLKRYSGNVSYDVIMQMKYLDQVISESLRKWPPGFQTDRVCTRDYTIQPVQPKEKPVKIKKGDVMLIPVVGIHRNPEYFPNPEKFDPDRFNEENKKNIIPGSYMPFGVGPRNCIGSRFALFEMKVLLFHLLSNFEIIVCDKTQVPLQLSTKTIVLTPENGFWVALKPRNFG